MCCVVMAMVVDAADAAAASTLKDGEYRVVIVFTIKLTIKRHYSVLRKL